MADGSSDKTEKATPQRRQRAREQGDFPRARDAGAVGATVGVLLALGTMGKGGAAELAHFASYCFRDPGALAGQDPSRVLAHAVQVLASLAMPGIVCAALFAAAVGFAQAGFQPQMSLVTPNLARLDPFGRIASMFGVGQALFDVAQSLVRLCVIGVIVYVTVREMVPVLLALSGSDVAASASVVADAASKLALRCTGVLAALAAADYLFTRLRWEQRNRMSKAEVKEEMRQQEGDPRVKAQARSAARARLRRGVAKQVRASDVVLANPTHISVALRYRAREGAPVVTAKGYDEVALYIRQVAKDAKVPVVENRLLARALAAKVRVGRTIPVELYAAVAEVLAFVYRLKGRGQGQRSRAWG